MSFAFYVVSDKAGHYRTHVVANTYPYQHLLGRTMQQFIRETTSSTWLAPCKAVSTELRSTLPPT